MRSIFSWVGRLGPAGYVLQAILASAIGIGLLLAFILIRRAYRRRYFRRRNARTLLASQQWEGILDGTVPPETWRLDRLNCEVVESILLDRLEVAPPEELQRLLKCLRTSGLIDIRAYEARHGKGWRRRNALLSLGRMRAPEVIPALAEGLDDPSTETRLAAVRGLGRTSMPEAAESLLEHFAEGLSGVPPVPLQNALLLCCRSKPAVLLPYVAQAGDTVRPLLARVLGEVASPEMAEELVLLAVDSLAEVRASAARALGRIKSLTALSELGNLVKDPEWFVRLRAVAALGELCDPRAISVLVAALCDENRYVRLRAAQVLSRFEDHLAEILDAVMETGDRYALQALVSEFERSGTILKLIDALLEPTRSREAEAALLRFLRAGTHRMLLDALTHHSQFRVRIAVARLLARSGEPQLVPRLQQLEATPQSPHQQRILAWVLGRLQGGVGNAEGRVEVAL